MKTNILALLALLVLLVSACNKDKVTPREYPRVKTLDVTNITSTGATFNAEIFYPGNQEIIEHGFVWVEYSVINEVLQDPSIINNPERTIIDSPISTGLFSTEISNSFNPGTKYTIRAYAKSNEYLVYGKRVFFTSLGN